MGAKREKAKLKARAERQVAAVRDEIGRWPAESAAEYDGIMRALEVE